MCGIAGYICSDDKPHPKVLYRLARSLIQGIEPRGHDAAGYAYVSKRDQGVFMAKAPVTATKFLESPGHLLSRRKVKAMPDALILHTRAQTKGSANNNENNHPIYSKSTGLCIVHNGWLINDDDLEQQYKLKRDAKVDSEIYLKLIEHYYSKDKSVEQGVMNATKEALGSIACGMIKAGRPNDLWIWRDDGDLALAKTGFGWVFASTQSALLDVLVKFGALEIGAVEFYKVQPQSLLHFAMGKPKWDVTELEAATDKDYFDIDEIIGDSKWSRRKYRKNRQNTVYTSSYYTEYSGNKDYTHIGQRWNFDTKQWEDLPGTHWENYD